MFIDVKYVRFLRLNWWFFMDNVRVRSFILKELIESLEVMELGYERFGCIVI